MNPAARRRWAARNIRRLDYISTRHSSAVSRSLATSRIHLEDYKGAIFDFTKAIELNPQSPDAYYARGIAKVHLEDYRGAIADYNKTIELNPKSADAYYARSIAKHIFGLKDDARMDFTKAGELGLAVSFGITIE